MSEYQYLEGIVKIKKIANEVAKIDCELNLLGEDAEELSATTKIAEFIGDKANTRFTSMVTKQIGERKKFTQEELD